MRLLYFFLPGCSTCAKVSPIVDAFHRRHPEIVLLKHDLTYAWEDKRVAAPAVAPSFALLRPGREPRTLSGETLMETLGRAPRVEDLERWAFR